MKTYILDIIGRFKKYSQQLDVKTILCSKAWYVLNEDGDTENLIFQEDGSVLVSINGSIKKYTWNFIPQNQSLNIMHSESEGTMLKPAFLDGTVLAFNKIGTKECMFLIDDSLDDGRKIYSLESVKKYLLGIEGEAIKKAKAVEDKKKAEEIANIAKAVEVKKREETQKLMEEQRRSKLLAERQLVIDQFASKEKKLKIEFDYENTLKWYNICKCNMVSYDPFGGISFWFIWFGLTGVFWGLGLYLGHINNWDDVCMFLLAFVSLPLFPIGYLLSLFFEKWLAYKEHKIFYDEYVKNTGECLEKFSYRIFYDIRTNYELFKDKMSKLNEERECALKKYEL